MGGQDPTTEAAAAGTGTRRRLVIQCLMDCMVYKTYTCGYFSRGVARGGQRARGHLPPLFSRMTRVLSISKAVLIADPSRARR